MSGTEVCWTIRYDYENRLVQAMGYDPINDVSTNYDFGYDGLGRRVTTSVDGVGAWFFFNGD